MLAQRLTWLGHAGFRLDVPVSLDRTLHAYIDPVGELSGPPADLILVTHAHPGHFSGETISALSGRGTICLAPPAVCERLSGNVRALRAGEELELGPFEVRGVAAYNTGKRDRRGRPFHERGAGLGFIVESKGERLYHSGDTDVVPEMDELGMVDVALLPVSGGRVMTAGEAAEAARRIDPALAVPMHWGAGTGSEDDARELVRLAPCPARILEPVAAAP